MERREDCLARDLDVARRARISDVVECTRHGRVRSANTVLLRRKLSSEDVAAWESTFGEAWHWLPIRVKGDFIPPEAISGSRHEWSKIPFLCKPAGCYLCGADFDCKGDLVEHWKAVHAMAPAASPERVEEEVRARLFYDKTFYGPVEVRGQEMRRTVAAHGSNQTQSVPGSGSINHDEPRGGVRGRALGRCAICARNFWVEDLHELDLFANLISEGRPREEERKSKLCVTAACVEMVNKLLDVRRYHLRWPKIPVHELYASSVQHPHVPEWRWLLHTHRIPEIVRGSAGQYPGVPACTDCAFWLGRDLPKTIQMPRYALANDNWIGRMPFAFCPRGAPLCEMTVRTLARGGCASTKSSPSLRRQVHEIHGKVASAAIASPFHRRD